MHFIPLRPKYTLLIIESVGELPIALHGTQRTVGPIEEIVKFDHVYITTYGQSYIERVYILLTFRSHLFWSSRCKLYNPRIPG